MDGNGINGGAERHFPANAALLVHIGYHTAGGGLGDTVYVEAGDFPPVIGALDHPDPDEHAAQQTHSGHSDADALGGFPIMRPPFC